MYGARCRDWCAAKAASQPLTHAHTKQKIYVGKFSHFFPPPTTTTCGNTRKIIRLNTFAREKALFLPPHHYHDAATTTTSKKENLRVFSVAHSLAHTQIHRGKKERERIFRSLGKCVAVHKKCFVLFFLGIAIFLLVPALCNTANCRRCCEHQKVQLELSRAVFFFAAASIRDVCQMFLMFLCVFCLFFFA
jgi:hypothetical protein